MIDNLQSKEKIEVEKLKVTKAEIVVRGTIDKPYYVIVYHEVGKDYDNEGFGSYYLENVFKWREEVLEIVDEKEQPQADKWIPCSERLPELDEDVLVQDEFGNILVYSLSWVQTEGNYGKRVWEDEYGYWHEFDEVIAWQPLPAPYKKEGAE